MAEYPILPGAEPFYFEGSDIGVLVSHGFTGTTQSMFFLGQY
ncbi:lipase, partial [bacterium]